MAADRGESSRPTRGDQGAKDWATARAGEFGRAVAAMRSRLGLSAVELSNRTREHGYPITRSAIAKIESNSRNGKFDVAEVVILAAALEVSPAHLMFPGYPDATTRVVPRDEMTAAEAWKWTVNAEEFNQWGGLHRPRVIATRDLFEAVRDFREALQAVEQEFEPYQVGDEWMLHVGTRAEIDGREAAGYTRTTLDSRYEQVRRLQSEVRALGGDVELPPWFGTYLVLPF